MSDWNGMGNTDTFLGAEVGCDVETATQQISQSNQIAPRDDFYRKLEVLRTMATLQDAKEAWAWVNGSENGLSQDNKDFLKFVANRLVYVYNENPNIDFVLKLHRLAKGEEK